MSSPGQLRRTDKQMSDDGVRDLLTRGYCARLATVGPDGLPYVVPLLYVYMGEQLYVHTTRATGHFRANIEHDPRVCFELDEPGDVFAYGRFECDTAIAFRSVIATGTVRIVEDREEKARFCSALMQKYARHLSDRPPAFFPRLDYITVYALHLDRVTGKETSLPAVGEQWPALDRTKSPSAVAPAPAERVKE